MCRKDGETLDGIGNVKNRQKKYRNISECRMSGNVGERRETSGNVGKRRQGNVRKVNVHEHSIFIFVNVRSSINRF